MEFENIRKLLKAIDEAENCEMIGIPQGVLPLLDKLERKCTNFIAKKMKKLWPGQIWVGKCLTSYQPNLWFIYVLLSADEKDGELWWKTAKFMKGEFGASVHQFLEIEIRELQYCGHIKNKVPHSLLCILRKSCKFLLSLYIGKKRPIPNPEIHK